MNLQESIRRVLREETQSLNENDELTNRILDKIADYGIESLSKSERKYLDNKSQDIENDEVSDIASIDTGYQFNDTVDDYEVRFIYNETEEWDEDPVEYHGASGCQAFAIHPGQPGFVRHGLVGLVALGTDHLFLGSHLR